MIYQDTGLCEDLARHTFWKVNDAYKAFALELATFPKVPVGTEIRDDSWRKIENEIGQAVNRRQTAQVLDACLKYEANAQRRFEHLRCLFEQKASQSKPSIIAKREVKDDDWD